MLRSQHEFSACLLSPNTRPGLFASLHIGDGCLQGKLIIAGGEVGHHPPAANGYSSTVDIFDTTTRQWTVGTLAAERQYFGGAMATPNLALFGGGD